MLQSHCPGLLTKYWWKLPVFICLFWLIPLALAQSPQPPSPPAPGQTPGGNPPRGMPAAPKPGVCPLPILPALPAFSDTAFYSKTDVVHGQVEQTTYKNYAGETKRMHIYLPLGDEKNTHATYPV